MHSSTALVDWVKVGHGLSPRGSQKKKLSAFRCRHVFFRPSLMVVCLLHFETNFGYFVAHNFPALYPARFFFVYEEWGAFPLPACPKMQNTKMIIKFMPPSCNECVSLWWQRPVILLWCRRYFVTCAHMLVVCDGGTKNPERW